MENDLISRKMVLALPRNKVRSLRTYEVVEETINVTDIEQFPSAQPEKRTEERTETHACDCISRQAAIDVCDYAIDLWHGQLGEGIVIAVKKKIEELPSAQPERTCVNCGRTANNGGWYADGGTRCPIEEHYALPKDGYCHLWEERNVTDDDYPERRTDEAD